MRLKTVRTLLFTILPALGGTATQALADGGYYVKLFGGLSLLQGDALTLDGTQSTLSYDGGTSFGGAIGYDYAGSPLRAELEYAYRSGEASDLPAAVATGGDFASTTVMLNGYYMFDTASRFQPYAGIGLGYVTEIDFDLEGGAGAGEYNDRGLLALQVMVGAEYPLTERFSAYGEARYFTAGTADLTDSGGTALSADYDTFDVNFGIAMSF